MWAGYFCVRALRHFASRAGPAPLPVGGTRLRFVRLRARAGPPVFLYTNKKSVIPAEAGTHENFNGMGVEVLPRVRCLRSTCETACAVSLVGPDLRRGECVRDVA